MGMDVKNSPVYKKKRGIILFFEIFVYQKALLIS